MAYTIHMQHSSCRADVPLVGDFQLHFAEGKKPIASLMYTIDLKTLLMRIWGIGKVKAGNITQELASRGPFKSTDDILEVPCVGTICAPRVYQAAVCLGLTAYLVIILQARSQGSLRHEKA